MSHSTVAVVIADSLVRADVARVFTSAGASPPLIEAARARGLVVIETASATAACIMAAVTAELCDAPGAALVSLAGALAPVIDGAAHATRDRAPVIVVSDAGADAHLLEPVTKASVVADAASAAHWIAHAAQAAIAYPRGAVHLAIPAAVAEAPALPVATMVRREPPHPPRREALDALANAIARASRPMLIAGLETGPEDAKWIRALGESLPAPVLTTPKGKGALPDPHPLALGLVAADHPLLSQADLLLVIGVDPVEVTPGVWPAGVPRAHVARSPQDDAVVGEIALVIDELAPRLRGRTRADWDVAALDRLKRALRTSLPGFGRRRVVEVAREMTPAGTLLALDVPVAAAWASVAPRELLIPNGVATAGFALPAAISAALAREDRRVVAIGAASGMLAMAGEFATAMRLGVPSVVVALDLEGPTTSLIDRARVAGLDVSIADDEAALRTAFGRAWSATRPVLVVARARHALPPR